MIGAGASGFQIAPAIADEVGSLTVLQRTAQWMFPNPNYHEPVGPGVQWALRHLPFYAPLVPVPDLLARLRQGPGRRDRRPRLAGPADAPSAEPTTWPG